MSWLIDILRSVVFWIDGIIYKLVGVVYDVFSAIATTTILSDKVLDIFSGKVYALVGIFMLFKVTFSLISYIVNPDEFVDKNKGFSKLIVNIITSLLLLVVFPFIYDEAMNIQKIVLDENIIGKIFTSSTYTLTSSVDGDFMAQETFTAFYHPNNEYNYSLNIYEIFNTDVNAKTNGDYDMYYLPVVSTIVGVILVLVLISFCFDIAVRSIKLDFLNMFAPIPIIARIDPKKGNETFNHWMKMFTSTYLDLFGRLIAIYFAIFIIGQIPNMNISSTDGSEVGLFVKVFIIMGVLLFAKQLPKLVEDLLGIKLAGNFQLNPLRKLEQVPLVGRGVNTLAGGVDSGVNRFIRNGHNNFRDFTSGFTSGVRRNWRNVPLLGGKGDRSVLETDDRKMRREMRQKRNHDDVQGEYMGYERRRQLDDQLEQGRIASETINSNKLKGMKDESMYNGVFSQEFAKSKFEVDEAKTKMYAWQNTLAERQAELNAAQMSGDKTRIAMARAEYDKASQYAGSAQGQYEYKKKAHDSLRQSLPTMAEMEDAIEAYEKVGGGKIIPEAPKNEKNSNTSDKNVSIDISNNNFAPGSKIKVGDKEYGNVTSSSLNSYKNEYSNTTNTASNRSTSNYNNRETSVQDRVNSINNVNDGKDFRQLDEIQKSYETFFNREDVAQQIDRNEQIVDQRAERQNEQREYDEYLKQQVDESNKKFINDYVNSEPEYNETDIQKQINSMNNVNEAPSKTEHDKKQEEYNSFFNQKSVSDRVDEYEQRSDYSGKN